MEDAFLPPLLDLGGIGIPVSIWMGVSGFMVLKFKQDAGCWGFKNFDSRQAGKGWLDALSDPPSQILGSCFEVEMVIQVGVIQFLDNWIRCLGNVGIINHPVTGWIKKSSAMHSHLVGVAVQPAALVSGWNLGELVSCFKLEVFPEFEGGCEAFLFHARTGSG